MKLAKRLEEYLSKVFGDGIVLSACPVIGPMYLRRFPVFSTKLFGREIAFAVVERDAMSPHEYARHASQIGERISMPVVFVFESITGSRRNAFLRCMTGFVVPGNQFFLPPIMDVKEWAPRPYMNSKVVSYAAQALVIRQLVKGDVENLPLAKVAEILGYSGTTLTKVAGELAATGIAEVVGARPKVLQFSLRGKNLWGHVRTMFRSPVKKSLLNRLIPKGVETAGLSALAERTLMSAPVRKVFAVDGSQAGDPSVCSIADSRDDAKSELQIWHYPPRITGSGNVDRYSLFLSLKDVADPRIEGALEDMMEDVR